MTAPTPPLAGAPDLLHLSDIERPMQGASPDQPYLPQMPKCAASYNGGRFYDENQMHEYALSAIAAVAPQSVSVPEGWRPSSDDYDTWCTLHDMRWNHDRSAFNDAASLYLSAAPATPLPQPQADADYMLIESVEEDGIEWGVSFCGPNPHAEDYVACKDKESALRLFDKLSAAPVSALPQQGEGSIDSEANIAWPEGYCRDPSGNIIAPAGKDEDFSFGYNLGYADGLVAIKDSVKAIEERVRARLARTAAPSEQDRNKTKMFYDLSCEAQRLHDALCFWLPMHDASQPDAMQERIAADAYLLVGYDDMPDKQTAEELGWISTTPAPSVKEVTEAMISARKALAETQTAPAPSEGQAIPTGTFECPICGVPKPHRHDESETIRFHWHRVDFETFIESMTRLTGSANSFFSIGQIEISESCYRLGAPAQYAHGKMEWAERTPCSDGYQRKFMQTFWEIYKDGIRAAHAKKGGAA